MLGDDLSVITCLEGIRWPGGVRCLRCNETRVRRLECKGHKGRPRYLYWCQDCGYEFSVTVGTLFEHSHLPLTKWFQAIRLMHSREVGVSAKCLSRELMVGYATAWSVAKRIRQAMAGDQAEFCKQIAGAHTGSHAGGDRAEPPARKSP